MSLVYALCGQQFRLIHSVGFFQGVHTAPFKLAPIREKPDHVPLYDYINASNGLFCYRRELLLRMVNVELLLVCRRGARPLYAARTLVPWDLNIGS